MVVVIGKLSHFGVYGKVFTGKDRLLSKLLLLSFCADGMHVAVEPFVSSPSPIPRPSSQAGVPLPQHGQPVPLLLAVARWSSARGWPGGHQLCAGSYLTTQDAETRQRVFCHSQAGPSWHVPISQLTITIAKNLSAAEGLKEASLINAITQTCLSHVSYLIPSQEKRHSSGHCLCLSGRDIQVPQGILLESRVALLCPGWQLRLGCSCSSRIQSIFLPGSDFIAGRALGAIQTSQAAFAAGRGSLPACPWHCVCPRGASALW